MTIEYFSSQVQHAANGSGAGVYLGPVELQIGLAAAALGRLHAAVADLLAWAAGTDENGLNVVCVFQSKAYLDRYAAEQLFPAFAEAGLAEHMSTNAEVTEYETGELYIR